MVKQPGRSRLVKISDKIRFEMKIKMEEDKPVRYTSQSPRINSSYLVSSESTSERDLTQKARHTPHNDHLYLYGSKNEDISDEIEFKPLIQLPSGAKNIHQVTLNANFDKLADTVSTLGETFGSKIEDLQSYLNTNKKYMVQPNLNSSVTDHVRKMISEEVKKQFEAQFEYFKKTLEDGQIIENLKLLTRERTRKTIESTVNKQYEEQLKREKERIMRGRKRRIFACTNVARRFVKRNIKPQENPVVETKGDSNISKFTSFKQLATMSNLFRKEYLPIDSKRKSIDSDKEIEILDNRIDLTDKPLLPSVPLNSIRALIHKYTVKSSLHQRVFSFEIPVFKILKPPNSEFEDMKSARTEADIGKFSKKNQRESELRHLNAIELNN